jgi:hypothetical protein
MTNIEAAEKDIETCRTRVAKARAAAAKAETRLEREIAQEPVSIELARLEKAEEYLRALHASAERFRAEQERLKEERLITESLGPAKTTLRKAFYLEQEIERLHAQAMTELDTYARLYEPAWKSPLMFGVEAPADRPRTLADLKRTVAREEGARPASLMNEMWMPWHQRWDDVQARLEANMPPKGGDS